MKINLTEFLKTGNLANIRQGMNALELRALLGNPPDTGLLWKGRVQVWKFGPLQLHIGQKGLTFFGLYFSDFEPHAVPEWEGWAPSSNTTKEEFEAFLRRIGVPFTIDNELTFDSQVSLRVDSGVEVLFHEENGRTSLDSIQTLWEQRAVATRGNVKEARPIRAAV